MKPKLKKVGQVSLSDKIADALTLKPRADIEDDQVFGTKPQTVSRKDLSSDSEDEAAISDFRKRNVNLLSDISKKYEGTVVSRTELDEEDDSLSEEENDTSLFISNVSGNNSDSDDSEGSSADMRRKIESIRKEQVLNSDGSDSDGESDDYSITKFQKETTIGDESGDDDEDEDDDDEEGGYDISEMQEPVKESFEHVKKQNVSEDVKKGNCVRNQLLIWEGLLEMRIHLQRCMNTANQMPLPDTFTEIKQNNQFAEECNNTKLNITNVLDKFLVLQNLLLKNNPETKSLSTNKKEQKQSSEGKAESDEEIPSDTDNEEIPSDTEPEDSADEATPAKPKGNAAKSNPTRKRKLQEYEKEIAVSHKCLKTFRDSTIQKWNDKTRLATATNIKSTPTNSVLQQISYILSDRHKLVKRTQLKRSEYDIVGYVSKSEELNNEQNGVQLNSNDRKDIDEYIPEIFDDSDFYHQLLRELIECKSADISDPVQLSRQWIALQQMRSKMKRKVDTKATKGRKIKYVVHNKLVNYMASERSTSWTDESTNELYSSLFGKMFEQNNVGLNANLDNGFKMMK